MAQDYDRGPKKTLNHVVAKQACAFFKSPVKPKLSRLALQYIMSTLAMSLNADLLRVAYCQQIKGEYAENVFAVTADLSPSPERGNLYYEHQPNRLSHPIF